MKFILFLVLILPNIYALEDIRVIQDGSALELPIRDDGLLELHSEWLYERCRSKESVDQTTRQRLFGPHEYGPPRLKAASIMNCEDKNVTECDKKLLIVQFDNGHKSIFDLSEIEAEAAYELPNFVQFDQAERPEPQLWNAGLVAPPMISYEDAFVDEGRLRIYAALQATGVVLIRGAPLEQGVCADLASSLSTLRVTEWGSMFDVKSVADPILDSTIEHDAPPDETKRDLAYTNKAIHLHTDNPYRYPTPDFQLLHAIEQCECNDFNKEAPCNECTVLNYFVDGFAVAQRMADETPELFDALASVPVRFENNGGDGSSALWHVVPHLEVKPQYRGTKCRGSHCILAIRFSSKSGGYAPPLPPKELETFYKAKRRFAQLAHSSEMYIRLQLRRGDVAIFDNTRLLHARSAIADADGDRYVQGCYFDRDGLQYNWERLRRRKDRPTWTSLRDVSKRDVEIMAEQYQVDVGANLVQALEAQRGLYLGQPVDLREHGLQTASRAFRANESDDIIVAALFHDVTEHIQPKAHGEAAAALLAPYIDPSIHWLLTHHEVFQGLYYFHHLGADPNTREALRDSPYFNITARFCELYDAPSFDFAYPSLPISVFEPIINRVLSRDPYWYDRNHLKSVAVTGGSKLSAAL
uniref:TauD/TfdA-like domain-containing protein n=1 Tax=Aureoumbra lagunensis TaxID=44058 RepID=A0A7S3K3K2_9STRA|mmetsp:Transcript_8593/g.13197  ORF Transcript_8593/g.13197 Transcript_8593/m.13197 type:complete len:641 (+) Transcript_8593:75-1997(+)|eukprot:CAMPEP_0197310122 /NCGR_PEP_ID=MMETSP0891-20130614/8747_1 /TAXON_ID=44058 ORGANISM="Aureoumbra lagunensis, Strain CCMP1510" /NCGR_SAMPLE_ID=MMETSP0891 /ASSEMBLY_ACC=CAM_ASM_000534 /LENGTH=640 /DNA_ID=CAMNT_0042795617 /DNA_START=56 /DNA_END=1978 /DNA_ORIENTATION=-